MIGNNQSRGCTGPVTSWHQIHIINQTKSEDTCVDIYFIASNVASLSVLIDDVNLMSRDVTGPVRPSSTDNCQGWENLFIAMLHF